MIPRRVSDATPLLYQLMSDFSSKSLGIGYMVFCIVNGLNEL